MRLSNLADYAVVLMSAAARHCGGTRTSAATLAAETGLPQATAHKLVHTLVRAGLLQSLRGQGGGVKLARPAAAISIADIVEAIEGPIALTTCVDHSRNDCVLEGSCRVRPHWGAVNGAVRGALAGISLASLTNLAGTATTRAGPAALPFLADGHDHRGIAPTSPIPAEF